MSAAETTSTNGATILQPGQLIRPRMTEKTAIRLVEQLYGLKVVFVKELNSYDDKNYFVQVDESYNKNTFIESLWPHGYILKVLNSMDSMKNHIDAEHEAEFILEDNGFTVSCPVRNVYGDYKHLKTIAAPDEDWADSNQDAEVIGQPTGQHLVRLMKFIPGIIFVNVPYKPALLYKVGKYIGKLERTLKDFSHSALTEHDTIWDLINVPKLKDFLYAVKDEHRQQLVQKVLKAFSEEVIPNCHKFQKGVIHGDYNEQNIIVRPLPGEEDKPLHEREHNVAGCLDFGDMNETCYVFEAAITIMYMMVESKEVDPMSVGGHVLAGYLTEMELSDEEFDALKVCVAGRFCQSLVMGAYSLKQDPGNEYLVVTAANGWSQLEHLWAIPKEELYTDWRKTIKTYSSD